MTVITIRHIECVINMYRKKTFIRRDCSETLKQLTRQLTRNFVWFCLAAGFCVRIAPAGFCHNDKIRCETLGQKC